MIQLNKPDFQEHLLGILNPDQADTAFSKRVRGLFNLFLLRNAVDIPLYNINIFRRINVKVGFRRDSLQNSL